MYSLSLALYRLVTDEAKEEVEHGSGSRLDYSRQGGVRFVRTVEAKTLGYESIDGRRRLESSWSS